jgi:hypothetical protein
MPKFNSTLERFMSHVRVLPNGCWEWVGYLTNGYGSFRIDGKNVRMPRAAWLIQRGQIPEGLEPDHLCRYRPCVNTDHMELVTHAENVRRGISGMVNGARERAKTHCPRGHEYTPENTRILGGGRKCLECRPILEARRTRKKIKGVLYTVLPDGTLRAPTPRGKRPERPDAQYLGLA